MSLEVVMEEKKIEQKLCKEVKKNGGIALKFVSPGFDGMPDRLILIAIGHMAFVEEKLKVRNQENFKSKDMRC